MLLGLLSDRLSEPDCVSKGWVLTGFPSTVSQANRLQASGFVANRIFLLNTDVEVVKERLSFRRVDPVTGKAYHLVYEPPPRDVSDRLLCHPEDEPEFVEENYNIFKVSCRESDLGSVLQYAV